MRKGRVAGDIYPGCAFKSGARSMSAFHPSLPSGSDPLRIFVAYEKVSVMMDLLAPLLTAAIVGFWILDVLRASTALSVMYALVVIVLGCLGLLGLIHIEVPRTWGAPFSNILVALGMVGAARMAFRGLRDLRRAVH